MDYNKLLNKIYYEEHNYDSIENLYIKAKARDPNIKRSFVKEWLSKQQTAQMNDTSVKKKEFLPIYTETPYSFQIDLTFFPRYKKQNDKYYVLFTAININTRYAYAYYSYDKSMKTILDILKNMEEKTVINSITADKGSEFNNKEFIDFCNKNEISLFFVKDDGHKLGIINRFHRTLKDKLTKYFTATDSVRWIDVINKIINNYNNTKHRSLGYAPKEVNSFIENELVQKNRELTEHIKEGTKPISIGMYCRIKNKRVLFEDKQLPKYSKEVYVIEKVNKNTVLLKSGNKEVTEKISNIKIVNKPDKNKDLVEQDIANKESRQERILNKESIDTNNIIQSKRTRKVNQ